MKLAGRRALITGSNQGFGLAVAEAYVAEGASVMLCARDERRLREAQKALAAKASKGVKVLATVADVANPEQIQALVDKTIDELGGLEILVANAGVYGPKGPIEEIDWDDWRTAIEVNLLGTVFCCRAVVPGFKRQKHGKIILLSGGGATKPMPFMSAYAASKAGMVRFGETLAEELRDAHIDVNSVAPGALNTRLLDEVLAAGPAKVGKAFYDASIKQKESGGTPPERGAELCVFLGSSASDGITGRLISAVWDPWERLPELLPQLNPSDIYTLRRIVPKDRGVDWGEKR
jgi:3-oxoacyl-[acyl-carrier protein] reductase